MSHTPASEILVNTTSSGDQYDAVTTALSDGGWVVAWQSEGQDGDGLGIYESVYNADGSLRLGEALVNTTTVGGQQHAQVAALDGGGWVVTWQDDTNVFQQAYKADGTALGSEALLGSAGDGYDYSNTVVSLASGGWVTLWSHLSSSDYYVYQQVFKADGTALTDMATVAPGRDGQSVEGKDAVALADGGWVTTWSNMLDHVTVQAFNADGTARGDLMVVSSGASDYDPKIAALSNGGWVVTWYNNDSFDDDTGGGIYQQAFNADGTLNGAETHVNTFTSGDQTSPHVVGLANGGWVVAWNSLNNNDPDHTGIVAQVYNADGTALGGEVITSSGGTWDNEPLIALSDGGWAVAWVNVINADIEMRVFNADGTARTAITTVNTIPDPGQNTVDMAALGDGGFIVTWAGNQDGSGKGVVQTRYTADGEIYGINHAPTAADGTVDLKEDHGYTFSAHAFGFSDGSDGDRLQSVTIDKLPKNGTLTLDGETVAKGEAIDAADLKHLVWTPSKDAFGDGLAVLKFSVTDDGGTAAGGKDTSGSHTLTFDVSDVVDTFKGTKGADHLTGTAGSDVLVGGKGDDVLTGKAGADRFVFRRGDGHDTIRDFDHAEGDMIDLTHVSGIGPDKAFMKDDVIEHGHDLWIGYGDHDRIVLKHAELGDLHRADILL